MNTIESTVSDWSGIEIEPHDRGGNEFTLDGREIGHIHGDRLVDIPFTKRIRDVLIEEERAEKHHVVPGAIWLLRLSYLHHLIVLRKQGQTPDSDAIDVDAELSELAVSETLWEVFSGVGTSE